MFVFFLSILLGILFSQNIIPCYLSCTYDIIAYGTKNRCSLTCGKQNTTADLYFSATYDYKSIKSTISSGYMELTFPWSYRNRRYNPDLTVFQNPPNNVTITADFAAGGNASSVSSMFPSSEDNKVILNEFTFLAFNQLAKDYIGKNKDKFRNIPSSATSRPADLYAWKFQTNPKFGGENEMSIKGEVFKVLQKRGRYNIKYSLFTPSIDPHYYFAIGTDAMCNPDSSSIGVENITQKADFEDNTFTDEKPAGVDLDSAKVKERILCNDIPGCKGELDYEIGNTACIIIKNKQYFSGLTFYITLQFIPTLDIDSKEIQAIYYEKYSWFDNNRYLAIGLGITSLLLLLGILKASQ
eukprot:GAHX01002504.1.p1 GENE.GAHX01002504.1~~GAHX01002504.1.p1  ORF type:complete len:354 (+),score=36.58 GAHX01002504.1:341-1402(+)